MKSQNSMFLKKFTKVVTFSLMFYCLQLVVSPMVFAKEPPIFTETSTPKPSVDHVAIEKAKGIVSFSIDWLQILAAIVTFLGGFALHHSLEKKRYVYKMREKIRLQKLEVIQNVLDAHSDAFYKIRALVHYRKDEETSDEQYRQRVLDVRDAMTHISKITLEKRHFIDEEDMGNFDDSWKSLLWMQGAFKNNKENEVTFGEMDGAVNDALLRVSEYLKDEFRLYE